MKYAAKIFMVGMGLLWLPSGASAQDPATIADGARAWSQNCTRCHNARSPLERSDGDWAIIVGHMRARAGLTKKQAHAITVYLQFVNRGDKTGRRDEEQPNPLQATRSEHRPEEKEPENQQRVVKQKDHGRPRVQSRRSG